MNLGEMQRRMEELNGWALDGNSIVKDFELADFKEALWYVNKIGEIAEKLEHHPAIVIDYNRVRVTSITHSENALTEKDFELAKEIDKIN